MQTTFSSTKRSSSISINFLVPQGWHELSDKQLRYVYQLVAADYATDEIKTLCLLRWSGIKAGLYSKPLEFGGFKIRVIQLFPNTEIFDCIAVSHPIRNHSIRFIAFMTSQIGQRDVVCTAGELHHVFDEVAVLVK